MTMRPTYEELEQTVNELEKEAIERRQAEKKLKDSELWLNSIFNSLEEAVLVLTPDRKLVNINEAGERMFGYSKDELTDLSVDIFHVDHEHFVEFGKRIQEAFDTGKTANFDFEIKRRDGEIFPTEHTAALLRGEHGEPIGILSVVRDVTEKRIAEKALRESEEKYRDLYEHAPAAYHEYDTKGRIVRVNQRKVEMLGYTKEEMLGQPVWNFVVESGKAEKSIRAKLSGEAPPAKGLERSYRRKDGASVPVLIDEVILKDKDSRIVGVRSTLQDITDRKRAEEALRKSEEKADAANKAKSDFLANMSHEIRTPMNAVIGFTDMLLDTDLGEDQRDYATTTKKSGETLLSLLNDILDFSKIEAGELDFEKIDFDPELLAYDVCEVIRPRIESKPIEILCHIGAELPPYVKGDPGRYRQVLTNLMSNASKFTETGEIELSLDIEAEEGGRVKLHAMIRDTAVGIPEDKLSAIFDPFQQADGSTTRKYGGTGLGLSICKQISGLMDGDIWAESEVNKGSIFHFTSWLGKAEQVEVVRRYRSLPLRGKKVLIVDDNLRNLEILTHVLESAGMGVVALKNGERVVPTLQKTLEAGNPFDICISDIQMPGMSGYEVAKAIRESKSSIRTLPMIALSSLMERDARLCKEAGFDGFLSKPIHRDKLFQMMERLLGERKDKGEEDKGIREQIMTKYSVLEEMKHSVRILLAEDNPVNQKLGKIMLTKAGYQVKVANNGKEAVEKYTASPKDFDLIFMDVQMPEMDGLEATKAIRQRGFGTIPIVAMTARAMRGDREMCLEAGMDEYITKPIKREIVFDVIEKWVLSRET